MYLFEFYWWLSLHAVLLVIIVTCGLSSIGDYRYMRYRYMRLVIIVTCGRCKSSFLIIQGLKFFQSKNASVFQIFCKKCFIETTRQPSGLWNESTSVFRKCNIAIRQDTVVSFLNIFTQYYIYRDYYHICLSTSII